MTNSYYCHTCKGSAKILCLQLKHNVSYNDKQIDHEELFKKGEKYLDEVEGRVLNDHPN